MRMEYLELADTLTERVTAGERVSVDISISIDMDPVTSEHHDRALEDLARELGA
jgi:hypothetical protein